MVNIKQLRSDIAGPILYQGATNVQRSLNLFYNDVLGYLSVNSTKLGTNGTESYVSGDAGTLKLKSVTNHFIDIQNNIIKYSAADHRILGKLYIGADIAPTANLHLAAGSTSSAAMRLTSGTLTTGGNILAGNLEFLTDRLYFTQTTSLTRQTIAYLSDITATIIIPNTQVVFGTGTGVASNDGFTHTGNGLATPGVDNYIEIGYLKLGYVSTVGIGIDGSAFGTFTLRNNLSILTIDRISDISGNFQFSLAGTELIRIKFGRLVLKNGSSLDFGEYINGPSRIEGENDMYISSSNNGTSNIIFRPAYNETFRLSTTLASLQTNLRLTDISSNGVIKTYFQAFSGEKGLVSYNNGASNYTGSSIPLNLSLQLYNATNDNSAMDIIISTNSNGVIYNLPTIIGTEYGTRTDKTGFRIGLLNTLHTSNTYLFEVGNLGFAGSGIIYNNSSQESFIQLNGSTGTLGSYSTLFRATQNNAKVFISGIEKLDINSFTADFKSDISVTATRTTIGAAFVATSNSYNLAGQSTIHVNDGSGFSLGIGYGASTTNYFMYGVSAGLYIRGASAGANKYGVFIETSGIVANGKSRIGDANFNTGHTLEVVGDLQVTDQSGTGNRIVESNVSGVQSASKLLINEWITDTTTRADLEDTGNWAAKIYTGPAIVNTFQSQKHYDADYLYVCVDDNEWIRIALI